MKTADKGKLVLAIGALGVVFGDIGTSPLYVLPALFGPFGKHIAMSVANLQGVVSLMLWTLTLVVSIKYIALIMRADNHGEGGIMALIALLKSGRLRKRTVWLYTLLGLVGVSLFYGDSVITPAISVLSAVEGLQVVTPSLAALVVPLTLVVLTALFWIQHFGAGSIGKYFGPVMALWFGVLAAGGVWQIGQQTAILAALNPLTAFHFVAIHPQTSFILMGAIVLVITGAEALYADMGQFGRPAVARAWFWLVYPSLLLTYMGQAALLMRHPEAITNPLLLSYPPQLHIPFIVLATVATLIASQAVISGAFSLTQQAVQLDFLPKLLIRHTSAREIGQVYVPIINVLLFVAVAAVCIAFGSSAHLANAYGVAVSGALAADTILFIAVAHYLWRVSWPKTISIGVCFVLLDLIFVSANVPKIFHGGIFPLLFALLAYTVLTTWYRGRKIISAERRAKEESLADFVTELRAQHPAVTRVPGNAVYIGHHAGLTPLALRAAVSQLHELHDKVVIVTVTVTNDAHIPEDSRARIDELGFDDGISQVQLSYGFRDHINVPHALQNLRELSRELDFNLNNASYFVSLSRVSITKRHNMAMWRKVLFSLLARNSLSTSDYYRLPVGRTIEIRSLLTI